MTLKVLPSVDDVFVALDGISGVMELTGSKYKTVHQWKASGSFPSNLFAMMTDELDRRGYSAPPTLWDQRQPMQAAS